MRKSCLTTCALSAVLLLSSGPILAHHAISAEFDRDKPISFTGVVKRVEWLNPHIYTQVEVRESDGSVVVYRIEGGAPNALFRQGIRPDSLKPGTVIHFEGIRAKSPESRNVNGRMTLDDGSNALRPTANR